jgi:hypothetical protein
MAEESGIKSWLREKKDDTITFFLTRALQPQIAPYGELINLKLDSGAHTVRLEVLLKGETESISVWIDHYQLITDGTGTYLTIERATASREWMTVLCQNWLRGTRFPIPEKYASLAKMLL